MIATTLGGVGLFLIGMLLVTDSLKTLAGDALRRVLLRFTGGNFKALLSGAGITALIQSSSATTVATIGFVGAGLITFQQAIGIVYGANLGTTVTGWLVALLGLKFSVTQVALPIVGVGALLRLFARGRAAHVGMALAGFGIIFVGIDILQDGMEAFSERVQPEVFPEDNWSGRLILVGLGFLLTAIVQSSSAAMATALAALHSGTISLEQAAAIVIGINVGTTATAGIAAIGGSVGAKRTALVHVFFNFVTGVVAFLTLPLFVIAADRIGRQIGPGDATIVIAAFHTAFNLLGILLLYPFTSRLARLVEVVVRDDGPRLTRFLDRSAGAGRDLAIEATRRTLFEIAGAAIRALSQLLTTGRLTPPSVRELEAAEHAIEEVHEYLSTVSHRERAGAQHDRMLSTVRALEHVERLTDLARHHYVTTTRSTPEFEPEVTEVTNTLRSVLDWIRDDGQSVPTEATRQAAERMAEFRRSARSQLFEDTADGRVGTAISIRRLDALRWLEEVTHALWRLTEHLQGERALLGDESTGKPNGAPELGNP